MPGLEEFLRGFGWRELVLTLLAGLVIFSAREKIWKRGKPR